MSLLFFLLCSLLLVCMHVSLQEKPSVLSVPSQSKEKPSPQSVESKEQSVESKESPAEGLPLPQMAPAEDESSPELLPATPPEPITAPAEEDIPELQTEAVQKAQHSPAVPAVPAVQQTYAAVQPDTPVPTSEAIALRPSPAPPAASQPSMQMVQHHSSDNVAMAQQSPAVLAVSAVPAVPDSCVAVPPDMLQGLCSNFELEDGFQVMRNISGSLRLAPALRPPPFSETSMLFLQSCRSVQSSPFWVLLGYDKNALSWQCPNYNFEACPSIYKLQRSSQE